MESGLGLLAGQGQRLDLLVLHLSDLGLVVEFGEDGRAALILLGGFIELVLIFQGVAQVGSRDRLPLSVFVSEVEFDGSIQVGFSALPVVSGQKKARDAVDDFGGLGRTIIGQKNL